MRDLILIVAGLAVPGIILALREYFGVGLPLRQAALPAPANTA